MIVDNKGKLFEDRRKKDKKVKNERRKNNQQVVKNKPKK